LELRHYFSLFRKWLWLIVLGAVIAGGIAYLVNRASTPIYRSTVTLLVNQAANNSLMTDYTSVITSQQLAKTYGELIKKRPTLEAVIRNLNLNILVERLAGQITVTPVRDTTLITVSVEDPDPKRAANIANELGKVFVAQIDEMQRSRFSSSEENLSQQLQVLKDQIAATQGQLEAAKKQSPAQPDEVTRLESALVQYQNSYSNLLKSYEDLRLAQTRLTDSVTIAEFAQASIAPVRPQTFTNTLLAAIVGALLAAGIAFLIEYLDDTVKGPDDINALNLPNLGLITRLDSKNPDARLVVVSDPRAPAAEAFRALRTNIQFASVDRPLRVLLITSAGPAEGKSTIAANLAAALAQAGKRVALVDADLRRPSQHRVFKLPNHSGLTHALIQDKGELNGALRPTAIEDLRIMVSGDLPPNPAELLGSNRVGHVLDELQKQVDVVIVDTPPCLVVTDAVALSKRADGVLLVADAGKTRRSALEQSAKAIQQVGGNVLGVVLNKYSQKAHGGYYNYQYYHSYYYAGDAKSQEAGRQLSPQARFAHWFRHITGANHNGHTADKGAPDATTVSEAVIPAKIEARE
jgi:non-specific protein-tyrosine kinase